MTTAEILEYYADLLIIQYVGLPKAHDMIEMIAEPLVMDQLPTQVQNGFNLTGDSVAVGKQLDILGKYAGVTRSGNGFIGPITLDDDDFLSLIQMGIIRNNSGSSLEDIESLLYQFFPGEIFIVDYQNMRISYLMDSDVGSQDLAQLFVTEGLLPKPMGVQLASLIYGPVLDRFFGFRTYDFANPKAVGFNTYDDFDDTKLWLSYNNGVAT